MMYSLHRVISQRGTKKKARRDVELILMWHDTAEINPLNHDRHSCTVIALGSKQRAEAV